MQSLKQLADIYKDIDVRIHTVAIEFETGLEIIKLRDSN